MVAFIPKLRYGLVVMTIPQETSPVIDFAVGTPLVFKSSAMNSVPHRIADLSKPSKPPTVEGLCRQRFLIATEAH